MRTSTAEANNYRCPRCGDALSLDRAGKGYVRHLVLRGCPFERGEKDGQGLSGWRTFAWISIDRGAVCVGDGAFVPATIADGLASDADVVVAPAGEQFALLWTKADIDAPVEVRRRDGAIVEARVCITDDVDELAGTWTRYGSLDLGPVCVVGDPFSTGEQARTTLDIVPGQYDIDVLELTDALGTDLMGIRLRR